MDETVEESLPDDLDLEEREAFDLEIPERERHVLLGASLGVGRAELPVAADLGLSLGFLTERGVRISLMADSLCGFAYVPRTERLIPVGIPSLGAGLSLDPRSEGALQPSIGVLLGLQLTSSRPTAASLVFGGRAALDIGRDTFAWTISGSAGAHLAPALPEIAGPSYRVLTPTLSLSMGPTLRL